MASIPITIFQLKHPTRTFITLFSNGTMNYIRNRTFQNRKEQALDPFIFMSHCMLSDFYPSQKYLYQLIIIHSSASLKGPSTRKHFQTSIFKQDAKGIPTCDKRFTYQWQGITWGVREENDSLEP